MKKLKKNQLEFNKEVITSLSESELSTLHGGDGPLVVTNWGCINKTLGCTVAFNGNPCFQTFPQTQCGAACGTIQIPPTQVTCQQSVCVICKPEMSKDVICP